MPNADFRLDERVARSQRPWGVLAHVRRQRRHDRPVLTLALLRDTLKRVDAAELDFELLAAELLDGLGEALGDPALPIRGRLRFMASPRCSGLRQGSAGDNCGDNQRYELNYAGCQGGDVVAISDPELPREPVWRWHQAIPQTSNAGRHSTEPRELARDAAEHEGLGYARAI
jgi:hypothetical protein